MKHTAWTILTVAAVLAMAGAAQAATLSWDFNNGGAAGVTLDWTVEKGYVCTTPGAAPWETGVCAATDASGTEAYDGAHPSFIFRSPTFQLDASGDILVNTWYGSASGTLPTKVSDIPENSLGDGAYGVALRDALTDDYVLVGPGSPGQGGSPMVWTAAALAPYVGKIYTLDYFDYNHANWGWLYFKDATVPGVYAPIPEPASATLIVMSGLAVLARRRRRGANRK
ncbi:MAG: hypothetical protein LLG01_04010 [Planctomycetaceae bacterium]|nr:hypothetical protein [Planctomycetaceae bacterium]